MFKKYCNYIALLFCSVIMCISMNVSAAENNVSAECVLNDVNISGKVNLSEGEKVSIIVLKPGFSDINNISEDEVKQAYEYTNHYKVTATGNYSFSYKMLDDDESGEYMVFIGGKNMDVLTTSYVYASKEDKESAVNVINASQSSVELDAFFSGEDTAFIYKSMGLYVDRYTLLNQQQKANVCQKVFRSGEDYTGPDNMIVLSQVFNDAMAVAFFNQSGSIQDVKNAISTNYNIIGLDIGANSIFGKMSEEDKQVVYKAMLLRLEDGVYADKGKVSEAFQQDLRIPMLNNTVYGDFDQFIINNYTYFGIDLHDYRTLDEDKTAVAKKMTTTTFETVKDIKSTFDKVVAEYYNKVEPPVVPGRQSGSVINASPVTKDIIPQTDTNKPIIDKPKITFNDLSDASWAEKSIYSLVDKNILQGDGSGKFYPNNNITREEFVKIIVLALGIYDDNAQCDFKDVKQSDWSYKYIASAKSSGIISGVTEDDFGVGDNITREDMMVIIYRCAKIVGMEFDNTDNQFDDHNMISDYAKEAVYSLHSIGIANGMGNGNFEPLLPSTRAQAAVVICSLKIPQ